MKLTEKLKSEIDSKSYRELLYHWRFAPVGDPMFQGDSGAYWAKRMGEMRSHGDGNAEHVRVSKEIGWER